MQAVGRRERSGRAPIRGALPWQAGAPGGAACGQLRQPAKGAGRWAHQAWTVGSLDLTFRASVLRLSSPEILPLLSFFMCLLLRQCRSGAMGLSRLQGAPAAPGRTGPLLKMANFMLCECFQCKNKQWEQLVLILVNLKWQ